MIVADDLYIGIDLGTTGMKVGLFDASGRTVAFASQEFHPTALSSGFIEFDVSEYADRTFNCVAEALSGAGEVVEAVRSIGFSSQGQTFVVVGADGVPLRPAVSWLDVRAGTEAAELSVVSKKLGLGSVNVVSSGPKLRWLHRHEPEVMERTRRVFLLPDYLIYRLTGCAVTDPIIAETTGIYDPWTDRWVGELLGLCGLDERAMPEVMRSGERAGTLTGEAARRLGLSTDVSVAVGTNDQYAGALGVGNVSHGCVSLALGTALAIVVTSKSREGVPDGVAVLPHPAAESSDELYALLAYAKTSGVVIRWFRDNFAPSLSYDELFAEIAAVPIGADGVCCVPHFAGTAAPDFNPLVRGAFSGLNLSHQRAHLGRALVESLAFTVRQNMELLAGHAGAKEMRAIGGGAKSDIWLQMIADATGVAVERPQTTEAACLGAAELAMAVGGDLGTVSDIAGRLYRPERRFEPNPTVRAAYDEACARCMALYHALYGPQREDAADDQV